MSHHQYHTEAFVLGSMPAGESNKYIDMFTADLGRVRAFARSVREMRSKLRFSLQHFSLSEVSLVRGKEVWRVVGAQLKHSLHYDIPNRHGERDMMLRLFSLLRRLLNGEEENKSLFRTISDALSFLRENVLSADEVHNFECLIALRILYNLGYLAKDTENTRFLDTFDVNKELISLLSPMRYDIVKQINLSLQESQL
ncbi:DNA repair protein RecO [Candidatus Kaiserbacteria bacterium]|nr:DNA repair protein RecO [Candidatus Kaiserbacteria bacterium]